MTERNVVFTLITHVLRSKEGQWLFAEVSLIHGIFICSAEMGQKIYAFLRSSNHSCIGEADSDIMAV